MKISPYIFLVICLFSTQVQAVYDYLSVDIVPTQNEVSFCFKADYSTDDNTYLAAEVGSQFYFLSQDKQLNLWNRETEPPIFTRKVNFISTDKEVICFDPFPKAALQDISVYAGVGNSLNDMIAKERYAIIYSDTTNLSKSLKDWTVMVYMIGSSLEPVNPPARRHGSQNILDMLEGTRGSNSDLFNLVISTGGSARYAWSKIKRSLIQRGQQHVLQDLGVQKMADSEALKDFVLWSKDNFPAQHYALILWGHGAGRGGYGPDHSEKGKGDLLDLIELAQTFQAIRTQISQPLDVVVYDACSMAALEVVEVTAKLATAMAASADLEPGHGIGYTQLLTAVASSPPKNGIEFAEIAKESYLQESKKQGTYNDKEKYITYSVFDLAKLPRFTETLEKFATEFRNILEKQEFLNYSTLSRGIIRAPSYPQKHVGTGRTPLSKSSAPAYSSIAIDFYNLLQTVGSDFPTFKQYADELLTMLDGQLIVDYEANPNITKIHPDAGRMSYDVSIDNSEYLSVLPYAYTLLQEGLKYYNDRLQKDRSKPDSRKVPFDCAAGFTCGSNTWLELQASDILGIEGYFGQKINDNTYVYLIKTLYRPQGELTEDLIIGIDGAQACQYQVCVDDEHCQDVTLTEQQDQLLADINFNTIPAVLSFCKTAEGQWVACGVVQRIEGIWGRDEQLSVGDTLIPSSLYIQDKKFQQTLGQPLVVGEDSVFLRTQCDMQLANVVASYYGNNQDGQLANLCDQGDCVCKTGDENIYASCREEKLKTKSGVILRQ